MLPAGLAAVPVPLIDDIMPFIIALFFPGAVLVGGDGGELLLPVGQLLAHHPAFAVIVVHHVGPAVLVGDGADVALRGVFIPDAAAVCKGCLGQEVPFVFVGELPSQDVRDFRNLAMLQGEV